MPAESGDIDVAAATAALEAAGGMPSTVPSTSSGYVPPRDPESGQFVASAEEAAPEASEEPALDWTDITEEAILSGEATPEMLAAMRRGMHAAFTQSSQEIAPWRKLGTELGMENPDDFRNAAQLYTQLQDPANWPTFHKELSGYMVANGMTPDAAEAAATNALTEYAPAEQFEGGDEFDGDSRVVQMLQAQQEQIAKLSSAFLQREQQTQLIGNQQRIAASLQAQEDSIRASAPNISETAIDAIYKFMAASGDTNLMAAKDVYDKSVAAEVQAYLVQKGAAHATTPRVLGNGQVQTVTPVEPATTLDEGHKRAMAFLAAQAASDA